ncbi:MAG: hypothetical protein ORN50_06195, partial [Crocinitomicaceae bacterium]|nr:hypothetical protein [Crocinitomicaceae bacterium]
MRSANDILDFHFSSTSLKQAAQKIIPITLTQINDVRIDKLQKITEEFGVASFNFQGDNLIPQIFRKFKSAFQNNSDNFDRRALRTLTYSLSYSEKGHSAIFNSGIEIDFT